MVKLTVIDGSSWLTMDNDGLWKSLKVGDADDVEYGSKWFIMIHYNSQCVEKYGS